MIPDTPVLGFAAFSGTGKTTLLVQLIPLLQRQGLRIAMIKHAHHDFDIDTPGKDSYELRKAGARQVLIASSRRRALVTEHPVPCEPRLEELVSALDLDAVDLVLVEGFRHLPFPKIELHRPSLGHPLLCREDGSIIAVASDAPLDCAGLPLLDISQAAGIADFILDWQTGDSPRCF
ncbi:MAG: molybdopterin-guanine dinucleotide biosynthesis protein B [Gammaproteobacteria bacterium]